MPDGTRLGARMWQPIGEQKTPAILEYIPYRKGDMMAISDAARCRYLAGFGYTCVRVDVRGSGDSEGILTDEYTEQEQQDGCAIIQWITEQPWSNGKVGLTGISWGGFNALQIAARQPPGLKAIISACSTDNRFTDDVHYSGGCVLAEDMIGWSASMMSYLSKPPDPDVTHEAWQEIWLDRLNALPHLAEIWLQHQSYDSYWQQGSVCEKYADINCPTFLVGGWSDGYTDSIFRLLENLQVPCQALIGPWAHGWPDNTLPGPQIGYLQAALRWWDHWLKDKDNGIAETPQLRYWQQCFSDPATNYKHRPGRWLGINNWQTRQATQLRLFAGDNESLFAASAEACEIEIAPHFQHGQCAGVWNPTGGRKVAPTEQTRDDECCVHLESAVFEGNVNLIGIPLITFKTTASAGQLVVRLTELDTDGRSLLISRGFVNLDQQSEPQVALNLDAVGHKISAGNRLRLSLSTSYWPMLWPSTSNQPIRLQRLTLGLPVDKQIQTYDAAFSRPELASSLAYEYLQPPAGSRTSTIDDDRFTVITSSDSGKLQLEDRLVIQDQSRSEMVLNKDFNGEVRCERQSSMAGADWQTDTSLHSRMTADQSNFYLRTELNAKLNQAPCFNKVWEATIPRTDRSD